MQPPVQLAPYGSSWMKMGSCPAKVKEDMKLRTPGTHLKKRETRWKASIPRQYDSSQAKSDQDEGGNNGLSRKCQSDSNIILNRFSKPKMPVRVISPKKNTLTLKSENLMNATWDVIAAPIKPSSLLNSLHPSMIPAGSLESSRSSLAHGDRSSSLRLGQDQRLNNSGLPPKNTDMMFLPQSSSIPKMPLRRASIINASMEEDNHHIKNASWDINQEPIQTDVIMAAHKLVTSHLTHVNESIEIAEKSIGRKHLCCDKFDPTINEKPSMNDCSNTTKGLWMSKEWKQMADTLASNPREVSFKSWSAKTA